MDGMQQLRLDGGVDSIERVGHAGFTPAQQQIIRLAKQQGTIRPYEAGLILHAARRGGCAGKPQVKTEQALGCCRYCSTDGGDALRRLEARGLLTEIDRQSEWKINEAQPAG